jgi:hypothetical protein
LALSGNLWQHPASSGNVCNSSCAGTNPCAHKPWRGTFFADLCRCRIASYCKKFHAKELGVQLFTGGRPCPHKSKRGGLAHRATARGGSRLARLRDSVVAGVHLRARPAPWSARSVIGSGIASFGKDQGAGYSLARPVPWSETSILVRRPPGRWTQCRCVWPLPRRTVLCWPPNYFECHKNMQNSALWLSRTWPDALATQLEGPVST